MIRDWPKKRFWSQDRFILWGLCNIIFLALMMVVLVLTTKIVRAGEQALFSINVGDNINVSSDKGIRNSERNTFEALGSVVITNKDEAIYGERALLNMSTGDIDVVGNVRYIGPLMTMFGQELHYNLRSGFLSVKNGKLLAKGYTVWGESMERRSPTMITAVNAEYTTCTDCPESWSVYGDHITVYLNEYIHIRPALVKSNQSPIFYSPYAVFPIKRGRQTGLLIPQLSFSNNGFAYNQPFFWAISEDKDATITPRIDEKKGLSLETEFRHELGEAKWYEFHGMVARDKVYRPDDNERLSRREPPRSGGSYFRDHLDLENHLQIGNYWNHHLILSEVRDHDVFTDYPNFSQRRLVGSELPNWGFVDGRNSYLTMSLEGSLNQNLMVRSSKEFDHAYVQTWPRIDYGIIPYSLLNTDYPFLQNISVGLNGSFSRFRQDQSHQNQRVWIRNADRFEVNPFVDWTFGSLGPFTFKTQMKHEYLYYEFPKNSTFTEPFRKEGNIVISEMFFEIEKIFGPAYKMAVPVDKVIKLGDSAAEEENTSTAPSCEQMNLTGRKTCSVMNDDENAEHEVLGELPKREKFYTDDTVTIQKDAHRHSLYFSLRHLYTTNQTVEGNDRFKLQVKRSAGLFDYLDSPRDLRNKIGSNASKTDISESNTLELRLFNTLFRKSAKSIGPSLDYRFLKDNFNYSKVAYFNLSQGIELNSNKVNQADGVDIKRYPKDKDRLTRLFAETGFPFGRWSLSASDYYFHQNKRQIFSAGVGRTFDYGALNFAFTYDSVTDQNPERSWSVAGNVQPWPTINYTALYAYDMYGGHYREYKHELFYAPLNNCWMTSVSYASKWRGEPLGPEKEILFNLYVNFGDNRYVSILGPTNSDSNSSYH